MPPYNEAPTISYQVSLEIKEIERRIYAGRFV